jgi:hypothetical protein
MGYLPLVRHVLPMSPSQRISAIREAFPAEGLFQDKDWKLSHAPLALPQEIKAQILALGPALQSFLAACDALYLAGAGLGEVSASLTTELGDPAAGSRQACMAHPP